MVVVAIVVVAMVVVSKNTEGIRLVSNSSISMGNSSSYFQSNVMGGPYVTGEEIEIIESAYKPTRTVAIILCASARSRCILDIFSCKTCILVLRL
jgi:hypothetical protein